MKSTEYLCPLCRAGKLTLDEMTKNLHCNTCKETLYFVKEIEEEEVKK